jgi:chromosome segregation ATPase
MTSSYIFNRADSTAKTALKYQQQYPDAGSIQVAGIFPLPRMISWWPDEKLISQNQELVEKNKTLESENSQMVIQLKNSEDEKTGAWQRQKDSLQLVINSLSEQLTGKQKQIDDLISSAQGSTNELQQKLADCIKERDKKNDALISCQASNKNLTNNNQDLQSKLNNCNAELSACNSEKNSLSNQVTDLNKQLTGNKATLQSTLTDLQTRLNNCTADLSKCNSTNSALTSQINELNRQLIACKGNQQTTTDLQTKLNNCSAELSKCNSDKNSLTTQINELNRQLAANRGTTQASLTDLLRQVCEMSKVTVTRRLSTVATKPSQDDLLRQQGFYKDVNWNAFCQAFNGWLNPVIIK